ncbi:hypothetical protein AX14_002601 [Amanita brunnescens Koide BX004]|nr:hypothetical protein AX14_002601 [Amanita brunnescens Koide BX004]
MARAARLAIAPTKGPLPTCAPNLMPFHIGYSGPAPISTYMLVEPSSEAVGAPSKKEESGDDGENNEEENVKSVSGETGAPQTLPSGTVQTGTESGAPRRHISTFRGRVIHSLDINLPEGYTGLVFRTEGQGISNTSAGPSRDGRSARTTVKRVTRRSKAIVTRDEEGDVELEMSEKVVQSVEFMDLTDDVERDAEEYLPTRALIPTAQFSSFRLWNADIPADDGADEYSRSLTEWITLARHIHQVPP